MTVRVLPLFLLLACGGDDAVDVDGTPTGSPSLDAERWEGEVTLEGPVKVAKGSELTIAAGTVIIAEPGSSLDVRGTLTVEGTAAEPVTLTAATGWQGIALEGTLQGSYLEVRGEGGKLVMVDGVLDLSDSVLDLMAPTRSPDCTGISGGSVFLDHVHITGCHCPIHINSADEVLITNSVFDGAAVAVMIASSDAVFTGNHIEGGTDMLDIGGGISADIAGNYWGGDAPGLDTDDDAQFVGADDWLASPIDGVGPR